jgi:hypothetical protein
MVMTLATPTTPETTAKSATSDATRRVRNDQPDSLGW